jgi:hypothetical protein
MHYQLYSTISWLIAEGVYQVKLGLSKNKEHAYMQCVDPGEPYTGGGAVIFDCHRLED